MFSQLMSSTEVQTQINQIIVILFVSNKMVMSLFYSISYVFHGTDQTSRDKT